MNETRYSDLQNKISLEISEHCETCFSRDIDCIEDRCVLYRIEKIIIEEE